MKKTLPIYHAGRIAILPRLAILTVVVASVLTGCSAAGPSKQQITDAINEAIKQNTSFSLQDNSNPTWPMSVAQGPLGLDPILADMQAAGYLKITKVLQQTEIGGLVDVITPIEEAKGWWNVQDGFCVGTKAVADVQEWTLPGTSDSIQKMQVKYTWHLVDVPSWAQRAEFKNLPGMTTPVPATIELEKTNNGWKAAQ